MENIWIKVSDNMHIYAHASDHIINLESFSNVIFLRLYILYKLLFDTYKNKECSENYFSWDKFTQRIRK